ncbi:O-antigen ligase family protein [Flavitalea flava]
MDLTGSKKEGKVGLVEISFLLVAVTMLFDNNWSSYSIVALTVVVLFSSPLSQKLGYWRQNLWSWLIPVAYFIWVVLNFLFEKSPDKSAHLLERNVALLAFPVVLGSMGRLENRSVKRILIAFVLSNIAGSFYCLYHAYLNYLAAGKNTELLFYHNLGKPIGLNAIYFAMYCLFSMLILANYYFFNKASYKARLLAVLSMLYLTLFIFLLASKMFIFLLCAAGIGVIGYACVFYRKLGLGILALVVFLGGMIFLFKKFSYAKKRIEYTHISKYSGMRDNDNGMAVRILFWQTAWGLIKEERGIMGMGQFTAQDSLQKLYVKAGFSDGGANDIYNSHNQYLYTWLCYGYIGLVILLVFLFRFLWLVWRKKLFLGIALALIFMIANITECMMETHKGIVFFLFFSSFFLFNYSTTSPAEDQRPFLPGE